MPRFFVDQPLEGQVFLGGEDGRHLAKSLRVRPGEEVTLCDGRGADALCKVLSIQGEGALLQVEKTSPSQGEPQTKVTVCQCLCKGDKLETVTQKAVELGAVEIWPLEGGWEIRPEKGGPAAKNRPGSRHAKRPGRHPPGAGARLPQAGAGGGRPAGGNPLFLRAGGGEPAPGLAGRRGEALCVCGARGRLRPRGGGAGPVFGGQAADLGAPHPAHGDSAPGGFVRHLL